MAHAGIPAPPRSEQSPVVRNVIFLYNVAWLIGLLLIAALYLSPPLMLKGQVADLKQVLSGSGYILSSIWFAVLGGVALSFRGLYEHPRTSEWAGGSWNLWYLGRPVSGIIVGVMNKAASARSRAPQSHTIIRQSAGLTRVRQPCRPFALARRVR